MLQVLRDHNSELPKPEPYSSTPLNVSAPAFVPSGLGDNRLICDDTMAFDDVEGACDRGASASDSQAVISTHSQDFVFGQYLQDAASQTIHSGDFGSTISLRDEGVQTDATTMHACENGGVFLSSSSETVASHTADNALDTISYDTVINTITDC